MNPRNEKDDNVRKLTKPRLLILLTLALLLPCSRFAWSDTIAKPDAQEIDGKINWIYDYEAAKRVSESSGKPMFVVFRCER